MTVEIELTDGKAAGPIEIVRPRLLLVEGVGDRGFFQSLFNASNRSRIQIIPLGTKSSLSVNVTAALSTPGFESLEWLGIALDADTAAGSRYASAINAIRSVKTCSVGEPSTGWSRSTPGNGQIASSLLVFPDGTRTGDRERYVWERLRPSVPATACVESLIECFLGCGIDKTEDWKARVNSLLHALRPKSETRPNEERNGALLFELATNANYGDILDLIPADDEEI